MTILQADKKQGNNKNVREAGFIPAILYGSNKSGVLLQVNSQLFKKFYNEFGESHVFTLQTPEGNVESLIHDIQKDPLTNKIIHVDFYAINKDKAVTVEIPIHFEGEMKVPGGVLVKNMTEITMDVLPKDIPEDFHIDVSKFTAIHDSIKISDLKIPASAKVSNLDAVIAIVTAQQEEVEDTRTIEDVESVHGNAKEEEVKAPQ